MWRNVQAKLRIAVALAIGAGIVAPAIWVCAQNGSVNREGADLPATQRDADEGGDDDRPSSSARQREGTMLKSEPGRFAINGDRIAFFPGREQPPLPVLENLALERIGQALTSLGDQRTWSVSGMITEFQGKNFLLVSRAVIQNEPSSRPAKIPESSQPE